MPPKRRRSSPDAAGPSGSRSSSAPLASVFAYEEIFLRIMSFLSPTDLALVQGVNKYWARMSLDPQLWKRQYLGRYPHPHHSRLIYKSGPTTPSRNLRPISRIPSRAFPPPSPTRTPPGSQTPERKGMGDGSTSSLTHVEHSDEVGHGIRNDGVDWKMMLRLGTNWSNGNALSATSIQLPPSPSPSTSSLISGPGPSSTPTIPPHSEQHIALFPSFIATSNPTSPLVHIHRSSLHSTTTPLGIIPPPPGWSSPSRPDNVTAIAADQAVSFPDESDPSSPVLPARLVIFYQSGGIVVLHMTISAGRFSWKREAVTPPHNRPKSLRRRATTYTALDGDPVILAAVHYPVIISCTLAFHLTFYSLIGADGTGAARPTQIGSMHSDVSFHPAKLSLFPASNKTERFRAALTYCTPLYPYSWTVAVQEFNISGRPTTGLTDISRGECWHVGRGDEDEVEHVWPRNIRPIVGVKGWPVGVGTDGRWAVLAGEDNQIQVYSLPHTQASEVTRRPIAHSHTLLAHSAALTSISLSSGRVVSGGRDGRVLVWELDEDVDLEDPMRGRTVAYVEVRPGGRRPKWRGAAGPKDDGEEDVEDVDDGLPHPQSISGAARSLFLPRLPEGFEIKGEKERDVIRQLTFDEEKIVGLVREAKGEVMKVWGFNE